MKAQDLLFFLVLLFLLWQKDAKKINLAGILCLVLAIPLFSLHIFFTAERLTWYAAAFFLTSIFWQLRQIEAFRSKDRRNFKSNSFNPSGAEKLANHLQTERGSFLRRKK